VTIAAIQGEGLVKSFGAVRAVDGVDLAVPPGNVLGLLGPNGAGKTTVVRMLATLVRPDAGRATVAGHDVVSQPHLVRESIGLTGQYACVDGEISGWENLYLFARLLNFSRRKAKARVDEMLARLDLTAAASRLVSTYSGGMRRRLDLAASLMASPRVLFLDEPTTGLDPHSRNGLWQLVRDLVAEGTTVLLTTQYMAEADELADNIAVMDRGKVIAFGPSIELRAKVGGKVLRIRPGDGVSVRSIADVLAGAVPEQDAVVLPITDEEQITRTIRTLADCGLAIAGIDTYIPGLDEVFLALTGKEPAQKDEA
jgi:oleandomycin transport system ATP-binding protein